MFGLEQALEVEQQRLDIAVEVLFTSMGNKTDDEVAALASVYYDFEAEMPDFSDMSKEDFLNYVVPRKGLSQAMTDEQLGVVAYGIAAQNFMASRNGEITKKSARLLATFAAMATFGT